VKRSLGQHFDARTQRHRSLLTRHRCESPDLEACSAYIESRGWCRISQSGFVGWSFSIISITHLTLKALRIPVELRG
jgi:hypothetical protein